MEITNQSMYLNAAQAAANQQAQKEQKTRKPGAASFVNSLKKNKEEIELATEGFPPEIAGLTEEKAIEFLQDAVEIAGEQLKQNPNLEQIENYKKKIGQFMRYISKNNFEVVKKRRAGFSRKPRKYNEYIQVQIINQKLDRLASDLLYNHSKNLNILARVEEINGLIIDLMAS